MFDVSKLGAALQAVESGFASVADFASKHQSVVDEAKAVVADAQRPLTKDEVFAEVGRLLDLAKTL